MADFFAAREADEPGLALFLNAGDPHLDALPEVITMLDESGLDVLELAVPFPNSFTDGPVIRASADRALRRGTDLAGVLSVVAAVRPGLHRLRIALLADWSHTVRADGVPNFLHRARDHGVDGVLLHGVPPRVRPGYHDAADSAGMPIVTTCYPNSSPEVRLDAARRATAYLYLVAHYGRSGTASPQGFEHLRETVVPLREATSSPIAIGFGVRTRADIEAVHRVGADAAIVGSAAVARVEHADTHRLDPVDAIADLVAELRTPSQPANPGPASQVRVRDSRVRGGPWRHGQTAHIQHRYADHLPAPPGTTSNSTLIERDL